MEERKLIKPAKGMKIPLHDGNGDLPENGLPLVLSTYWHRLEQAKDVTFHDIPAESTQSETTTVETAKPSKSK